MKKKRISIIVACYNEEENIEALYQRVVVVFKTIKEYDFELIYVDNASVDNSLSLYKKLTKKDTRVKVIIMSRNFGSGQPSFVAGMEYATGQAAVFLHGDIQDPPELIGKFITQWEKGYDVVYGVRKKRKGYNIIWNMLYRGFYIILRRFSYITMPLDAGEFSLVSERVYKRLLEFDETDYYLRCLRAFVGFKQVGVEYIRDARLRGRSTESMISGFLWAKTILINFSFKPLEWISLFGFVVMLFTFALIVVNLIVILFTGDSPRGVPTIVILILFLGGVQLLSLSFIAEYVSRIFLEVKRRPKYIVDTTINLPKRSHIIHL